MSIIMQFENISFNINNWTEIKYKDKISPRPVPIKNNFYYKNKVKARVRMLI
jgi:hypothetical protein